MATDSPATHVSESPLTVKVWGEFACFTRPEMKVERVSYPVITPSAARGVLEAIFWKPEFTWIVREIQVLKPINYISLLRNEIKSRQSERSARNWASADGIGGFEAPGDRTQRHTLALRDVGYIITADIELRPGVDEHPAKYRDQFRRRVRRGACFSPPYLGCREFAAAFEEPGGAEETLSLDSGLGRMLLGIAYPEGNTGAGLPRFFDAEMRRGVITVPYFNPHGNGGDGDAATAAA